MRPSGLAATTFSYEEEDGTKTWRVPMESAEKGRLRTSKGRMMKTDGSDNDHIPYE